MAQNNYNFLNSLDSNSTLKLPNSENIFNPLNSVWGKISSIDFGLLCATLSNIALVFLAVVITIFVLTVTILGKAARIAKEKKDEEEQKSNQSFDEDIKALQKSINKDSKNIDELKKKIADIETKKNYTTSALNDLDKKYNALGIKESVLVPGACFFITIIFSNWLIFISQNKIWEGLVFLISTSFLFYGVKKVLFTLLAIQYFSLNIKDDQAEQFQNAMVRALKSIEKDKEPKPYIKFIDNKPPFIFKVGIEAIIKFEIELKTPGSTEAKNLDVWFLTSPEVEILEKSGYGTPFKQGSDYSIPSANTIIYKFATVRTGTRSVGEIKIKTTVPGNFKMRYKIDCDNHSESANKEIGIIVQD